MQEHRDPSGRYYKDKFCPFLSKIDSCFNWRDFYLFFLMTNILLKFKFKLCFIYTHMASDLNFQHFVSLLDSTQLVWVIWWEKRSINKRKCNVHCINRIIDCIYLSNIFPKIIMWYAGRAQNVSGVVDNIPELSVQEVNE